MYLDKGPHLSRRSLAYLNSACPQLIFNIIKCDLQIMHSCLFRKHRLRFFLYFEILKTGKNAQNTTFVSTDIKVKCIALHPNSSHRIRKQPRSVTGKGVNHPSNFDMALLTGIICSPKMHICINTMFHLLLRDPVGRAVIPSFFTENRGQSTACINELGFFLKSHASLFHTMIYIE